MQTLGRVGQGESSVAFSTASSTREFEGEAVTATRKIKRSLLQQQFSRFLIDEMYADDEERRIARQLH